MVDASYAERFGGQGLMVDGINTAPHHRRHFLRVGGVAKDNGLLECRHDRICIWPQNFL
jgi:hypothetical protein